MEMKTLILKKIEKDMENVKIVYHEGSLWFIHKVKKDWLIECKNGHVIWNHDFLSIIPKLFGVRYSIFAQSLKEYVYKKINYQITTCYYHSGDRETEVNSVIESINSFS